MWFDLKTQALFILDTKKNPKAEILVILKYLEL